MTVWDVFISALLAPWLCSILSKPSFCQRIEHDNASTAFRRQSFLQCLRPRLSPAATIQSDNPANSRWSDFEVVAPGIIVNVATEKDVAETVQCASFTRQTFLAQNGATSWSTTFDIDRQDVLINLRRLRAITFNPDKTQVTIQGGTLIEELVSAAYANDAQVLTGNCNCVGTIGSLLGGGYGRLMGLYGLAVDNVLSFNLVTWTGTQIHVTATTHPDLWFALRGAGHNFGIVTSAVLQSYPTPRDRNGAWLGALVYTDDKIEALIAATNALTLTPPMALFIFYATTGPPSYFPAVIAFPFYAGPTAAGRAAFASLFALEPILDQTSWQPLDRVNDGSGPFCAFGGRKPSYGAAMATLDPAAWRTIWDDFVAFLANPGTGSSAVLLEAYALDKAKSLGDGSSSYAFRSENRFNAVAIPWYQDAGLDGLANAFGAKTRELWRSTGGLPRNNTYINFAFGDEPLHSIYGDNVERLRSIKRRYDPLRRFNQYFPL